MTGSSRSQGKHDWTFDEDADAWMQDERPAYRARDFKEFQEAVGRIFDRYQSQAITADQAMAFLRDSILEFYHAQTIQAFYHPNQEPHHESTDQAPTREPAGSGVRGAESELPDRHPKSSQTGDSNGE